MLMSFEHFDYTTIVIRMEGHIMFILLCKLLQEVPAQLKLLLMAKAVL